MECTTSVCCALWLRHVLHSVALVLWKISTGLSYTYTKRKKETNARRPFSQSTMMKQFMQIVIIFIYLMQCNDVYFVRKYMYNVAFVYFLENGRLTRTDIFKCLSCSKEYYSIYHGEYLYSNVGGDECSDCDDTTSTGARRGALVIESPWWSRHCGFGKLQIQASNNWILKACIYCLIAASTGVDMYFFLSRIFGSAPPHVANAKVNHNILFALCSLVVVHL